MNYTQTIAALYKKHFPHATREDDAIWAEWNAQGPSGSEIGDLVRNTGIDGRFRAMALANCFAPAEHLSPFAPAGSAATGASNYLSVGAYDRDRLIDGLTARLREFFIDLICAGADDVAMTDGRRRANAGLMRGYNGWIRSLLSRVSEERGRVLFARYAMCVHEELWSTQGENEFELLLNDHEIPPLYKEQADALIQEVICREINNGFPMDNARNPLFLERYATFVRNQMTVSPQRPAYHIALFAAQVEFLFGRSLASPAREWHAPVTSETLLAVLLALHEPRYGSVRQRIVRAMVFGDTPLFSVESEGGKKTAAHIIGAYRLEDIEICVAVLEICESAARGARAARQRAEDAQKAFGQRSSERLERMRPVLERMRIKE